MTQNEKEPAASTPQPGPAETALIETFEKMIDEAAERMTPEEFAEAARKVDEIIEGINKRQPASTPLEVTAHKVGVCKVRQDPHPREISCIDWVASTPVEAPQPPQHAFEVSIRIGGNDWYYVLRTMDELAYHLRDHGPDCGLCSGGAGGSHSVSIARRDITPAAYRVELEHWRQNVRK